MDTKIEFKQLLESALYTDDLKKARTFYENILGLTCFSYRDNHHAFFKAGSSIILLFNPELTKDQNVSINGNHIPAHASFGQGHIALEVGVDDYDLIKQQLIDKNITIESEVLWPSNKYSFYFRDPDGNSLEITQGNIWI